MEKLSGSRGCFVCGDPEVENFRSLGLDIFWDEDQEETLISIDPDYSWCGYENTVHGGIIAAIMDDSMAWAVQKTSGAWGVTAKMNITYRKPVTTGTIYSVTGSVVKKSGSRISTKCRLTDSEENIFAEAEALFILKTSMEVSADEKE